ncbi:MAG: hypothetical protein U0517_03445 [Candidatus Andersenbacteria bacterium]
MQVRNVRPGDGTSRLFQTTLEVPVFRSLTINTGYAKFVIERAHKDERRKLSDAEFTEWLEQRDTLPFWIRVTGRVLEVFGQIHTNHPEVVAEHSYRAQDLLRSWDFRFTVQEGPVVLLGLE